MNTVTPNEKRCHETSFNPWDCACRPRNVNTPHGNTPTVQRGVACIPTREYTKCKSMKNI